MTRTDTNALIEAMHALARDIQSGGSVANAAIREAAERLEELQAVVARIPTVTVEESPDSRTVTATVTGVDRETVRPRVVTVKASTRNHGWLFLECEGLRKWCLPSEYRSPRTAVLYFASVRAGEFLRMPVIEKETP